MTGCTCGRGTGGAVLKAGPRMSDAAEGEQTAEAGVRGGRGPESGGRRV